MNKKCGKSNKKKNSLELTANHNSTYFTKKERSNKQMATSIGNNKNKKKETGNSIVAKLRNNKTCEDGFDNNNNSALLLTDIPFDPFQNKNGSFHNLKNTKSTHNKSINNINNDFKSTSTCHRNYPLKSPNLICKRTTPTIQTTIINNRNNSYENVSRYPQLYTSDPTIMSKLENKFQTFEVSIIDKNYENNIKNDEMIQKKDNKKSLEKMINENSEDSNNRDTLDLDYNKELNNNEEDMRSIFNSIKEDFNIFYTKEYIKAILDDTIKLELQLVIDKLCELQEMYHRELLIGCNNYNKYKEIFDHYSEKYLSYHKKYLHLKHEQERAHLTNTLYTFISNHKFKHDNEIISINKTEILIWNTLPVYSPYVKAKCAIKDSNDSIFKKKLITVFDEITKRNKINLSIIEKKFCDRTVIKHSRTRSMEEPEKNFTMQPIISDIRNVNEIKADVKSIGMMKSIDNSHNKLISLSEIANKKKERKSNKNDKYSRPLIKNNSINK